MDSIISTEYKQKLCDDIQRLRNDLHQCLEKWFYVNQVKKVELLEKYDLLFKDSEVTIQKKSLELSEIQRRVELLMIKVHRGEKITPEIIASINYMVDKEYERLHERMYELSSSKQERNIRSETDDSEIPKLYRLLAKKLHPDYNDVNPFTKRMWENTQQAYQHKDIRTLQSLYEILIGTNHDISSDSDSLEMLESQKKKLEATVGYEQKKLAKLLSQEPFTLEQQLSDDIWISFHRLELQKNIDQLENDIRQTQKRYKNIVGEEHISNKEITKEQNFEQTFSDTTYFGQR